VNYPGQEYWWEHNPRIRKHEENWEAKNMSAIEFRAELEKLVNKHSMENGSNTPDFVLAEFLHDCLQAFDEAVVRRTKWHGTEKHEFPTKLHDDKDPVTGEALTTVSLPVVKDLAIRFSEYLGRSSGVVDVASVIEFLQKVK